MSNFDFSSFLKSIAPPQTPTDLHSVGDGEQDMGLAKKLSFGKYITEPEKEYDDNVECNLQALFKSCSEEYLPQMLVRTVTHLNSENACSAARPGAKQIAVNEKLLCYALKQGELRIISRSLNDRILIKNHTAELVDIKFLCYEKPFLLLAGLDQKITLLDLSDEITEPKGKILLTICINESEMIDNGNNDRYQLKDEGGYAIKLAWGPISDLLFVFSYRNRIVFLNWSKVLTMNGGGEYYVSPDTDGDAYVRTIDFGSEIISLGSSPEGNLYVSSSDGTCRVYFLEKRDVDDFFCSSNINLFNRYIDIKVPDGPVRYLDFWEIKTEIEEINYQGFITASSISTESSDKLALRIWNLNLSSADLVQTLIIPNFSFNSCEYNLYFCFVPKCDILLLSVGSEKESSLYAFHLIPKIVKERKSIIFESVAKFPVKLQINSMDVARDLNKEDMTKGFLDIFCFQCLCVQQYMLDPDLCLPQNYEERSDEEKIEELESNGNKNMQKRIIEKDFEKNIEITDIERMITSSSNAFPYSFGDLNGYNHPQIAPILTTPTTEAVLYNPSGKFIYSGRNFNASKSLTDYTTATTTTLDSSNFSRGSCSSVWEENKIHASQSLITMQNLSIPLPDTDLSNLGQILEIPIMEGGLFPSSTSSPSSLFLPPPISSSSSSFPETIIQRSSHYETLPSQHILQLEKLVNEAKNARILYSTGDENPEPPIENPQPSTSKSMDNTNNYQIDSILERNSTIEQSTALSEKSFEDNKSNSHVTNGKTGDNTEKSDEAESSANPDFPEFAETVEKSVSDVKRLIQVLEHKLGRAFHSLNKRLDSNFKEITTRLESTKHLRDDIELHLRENSQATAQHLSDIVQSTVQNEVKNTLRTVVSSALQRVFAEFLSRQLSGVLQRCIDNSISGVLPNTINSGLNSSFRDNFSTTIVPAFESAVQNMFGQIESAFSECLTERLSSLGITGGSNSDSLQSSFAQLSTLTEAFGNSAADIKNQLSDMKTDINCIRNEIEILVHSAAPIISSQQRISPDATIAEIASLLQASNYEAAFNKTLSLSNIEVLNRIISQLDESVLFDSVPCPLSQSVLLSLLNQLGCDLDTDTTRKLEWIRGALTHLESTPGSPRVTALSRGVIDYLAARIKDMCISGTLSGALSVSAKKTLHMLIGVRNSIT